MRRVDLLTLMVLYTAPAFAANPRGLNAEGHAGLARLVDRLRHGDLGLPLERVVAQEIPAGAVSLDLESAGTHLKFTLHQPPGELAAAQPRHFVMVPHSAEAARYAQPLALLLDNAFPGDPWWPQPPLQTLTNEEGRDVSRWGRPIAILGILIIAATFGFGVSYLIKAAPHDS